MPLLKLDRFISSENLNLNFFKLSKKFEDLFVFIFEVQIHFGIHVVKFIQLLLDLFGDFLFKLRLYIKHRLTIKVLLV